MNNPIYDFSAIRLIVADMDGTLLDDDKCLDSEICEMIPKLSNRGIGFTLASGRNVHIIKPFLKDLKIDLPYIANNGANIYQNDKCIYEKSMDPQDLNFALSVISKSCIPYIAYTNHTIYVEQESPQIQFFLNRLRGKTKICIQHNMEELLKENIFKVVLINENADHMKSVMKTINTADLQLQCVRSEDHIYTLTHNDATKGKTLEKVLDILDINPSQVLVFGDNFNDVSMFEHVGVAVAMRNAQEVLKEKAHYVGKSNNENGVSAFIQEHILMKE